MRKRTSPPANAALVADGRQEGELTGPQVAAAKKELGHAEGVAGIVWAATLPDDGPSGGLFRDGAPIPW